MSFGVTDDLIIAFNRSEDKLLRKHLAHAIRRSVEIATNEALGITPRIKSVLTKEEIELGRTRGKIECIKAYRNRGGGYTNEAGVPCHYIGLKEAKDTVEAEFARLGISFYTGPL